MKKSYARLQHENELDALLKGTKFDHTTKALWRYWMRGEEPTLIVVVGQIRDACIDEEWVMPFALKVLNAWLSGGTLAGHVDRPGQNGGHYCSDWEASMSVWDEYPNYRKMAFERSRKSSLESWKLAYDILRKCREDRLKVQAELVGTDLMKGSYVASHAFHGLDEYIHTGDTK